MGKLLYGSLSMEVDFEDRALAHLQVVITSKLRRGERFMFSWTDSLSVGNGRSCIWLDPSIPLYFRYFHKATAPLSREWIDELMESANGPHGLQLMSEPGRTTKLPESQV